MLHLASRSCDGWAAWAVSGLDEILLDHAHCEKKAASTAMSLIFRYPERPDLMLPLSALAREELGHFELVIGHIRRRKREFRRQHPSPYAAELMAVVRTHEPLRLLDTLLCCALIEARSCERMQLLAGALEDDRVAGRDPALAKLYRGLLACEARHHGTYVELARSLDLVEGSEFERRFAEVSEHEAAVIDQAPDVYRLHAGHRSAIRPQSDRSRR